METNTMSKTGTRYTPVTKQPKKTEEYKTVAPVINRTLPTKSTAKSFSRDRLQTQTPERSYVREYEEDKKNFDVVLHSNREGDHVYSNAPISNVASHADRTHAIAAAQRSNAFVEQEDSTAVALESYSYTHSMRRYSRSVALRHASTAKSRGDNSLSLAVGKKCSAMGDGNDSAVIVIGDDGMALGRGIGDIVIGLGERCVVMTNDPDGYVIGFYRDKLNEDRLMPVIGRVGKEIEAGVRYLVNADGEFEELGVFDVDKMQ